MLPEESPRGLRGGGASRSRSRPVVVVVVVSVDGRFIFFIVVVSSAVSLIDVGLVIVIWSLSELSRRRLGRKREARRSELRERSNWGGARCRKRKYGNVFLLLSFCKQQKHRALALSLSLPFGFAFPLSLSLPRRTQINVQIKKRKEKEHPKMPNVFISTSSSLFLLLPGVALKRRLARPRRSLVAVAVPRRGRVRRLRQRRRWQGGPGVRDAWRRQGTSSAGPSATPAAAVAVAGPLFSTAPPSSHSSHPKLRHFLDQRSPASEFVI